MIEQIRTQVVLMLSMMKKTRKSKTVSHPSAAAPAPIPVAPENSLPPQPGRVSFQLVKPDAQTVYVAGSFNGWKPEQTPLVKTGNGRWVGDLTVQPGRHEYLFVVDGQWLPDPNARETVQNPFGGKNSVLTVSE
jgi:1,4-alpha-glucan branching enzyme